MKKIFSLVLVAFSLGCATMQIPGVISQVVLPNPGVEVRVFNQCTQDPGRLYVGSESFVPVNPGSPTIMAADRGFLNGSTQNINMVYQVYRGQKLLGTITKSFYIQNQSAVTRYDWIIGGNISGGGSNAYYDHLNGIC